MERLGSEGRGMMEGRGARGGERGEGSEGRGVRGGERGEGKELEDREWERREGVMGKGGE